MSEMVSVGVSVDDELSRRLAESLRDYARLLGDYQEIAARLVLSIEAGASIADGEATRLMVADHAAGRGIDGCCTETARRIASAIRATDKADARARRVAAQRTAEGERDDARAEVTAAFIAGAEAMREHCAAELVQRAAWAHYRTEYHTAAGDDPDDTAAQSAALDGALRAIRALPVPPCPSAGDGR